MSAKPTVTFFGATGGCTLNTLGLALKNGYPCIAFARTPAKLTKLLIEAPHSIPQATVDAQLEIVAGDIYNAQDVKQILAKNPAIIISGLGGTPKLGKSPMKPFDLDQPNVCETAAQNIVHGLNELNSEGKLTTKPFFVAISSTGLSMANTRDLPVAMIPFYKFFLNVPHADKEAMEAVIVKATQETPSVFSGLTIVRPAFLWDGESKGLDAVKTGWERHHLVAEGPAGPGPAVGYAIRRVDVDLWMYENLVCGNISEWDGRCVSLTY